MVHGACPSRSCTYLWPQLLGQGEISRFTVPEMYLTGGPSQYLAKLPDDGEEVIFDIELVSVVGIRDIFGSLGQRRRNTGIFPCVCWKGYDRKSQVLAF